MNKPSIFQVCPNIHNNFATSCTQLKQWEELYLNENSDSNQFIKIHLNI